MDYKKFMAEMTNNPTGLTARTSSDCVKKELEEEVVYPKFYHDFGEFERLEFT